MKWICPNCGNKTVECLAKNSLFDNNLFDCIHQGCDWEIELPVIPEKEDYFKITLGEETKRGRRLIEDVFEQAIEKFGKEIILQWYPDKTELENVLDDIKGSSNSDIWECYNIALRLKGKMNVISFIRDNKLIERLNMFKKQHSVSLLVSAGNTRNAITKGFYKELEKTGLKILKSINERMLKWNI